MSAAEPSAAHLRGAVDLSGLARRHQAPPAGAPAQPGQSGAPAEAPGATAGQTVDVPSFVFDATDDGFGQVVELSSVVPVVIDLWAEWCGPCKQLSPVLERLAAEYAGRFVLAKVDVDANPQLSQAFQAQSIPMVVAVVGGRPVPMFNGAIPESQVREVIEQLLQLAAQNGVSGRAVVADGATAAEEAEPVEPPLPPLHAEAYEAIERADYPTAIAAYEKAIAQNPKDDMAVAGLAQVRLLHRLGGKTLEEIRSRAAAAPADLDAQLAVADLDLSGGHVDDAFDRLLTMFPELDQADKDTVRTRLLELFQVAGVTDPRVMRARARLTGLLY
ncbi:thioredoxin [Plantibacter sp. Leaf171]|uniref:tetratricopeptide repeat protein n=1 Tax=unclassified Plantibacter TaxID=2624265 RepID=UPI0006F2E74C|nr:MULTISPECIES: tetratricopeptide repeat protein [unclassified Plantibacter]KQM15410.1 thioredoxin [Plantibacter sp. Leaf1]KQR58554.1 thioredoxin [Plantibacter sp. Leaf171]